MLLQITVGNGHVRIETMAAFSVQSDLFLKMVGKVGGELGQLLVRFDVHVNDPWREAVEAVQTYFKVGLICCKIAK